MGGRRRDIPVSISIVVATRKKIKRRKAMSAIEPALISCISLLAMGCFIYYLQKRKSEQIQYSGCKPI
jgi:hypothetical protein